MSLSLASHLSFGDDSRPDHTTHHTIARPEHLRPSIEFVDFSVKRRGTPSAVESHHQPRSLRSHRAICPRYWCKPRRRSLYTTPLRTPCSARATADERAYFHSWLAAWTTYLRDLYSRYVFESPLPDILFFGI